MATVFAAASALKENGSFSNSDFVYGAQTPKVGAHDAFLEWLGWLTLLIIAIVLIVMLLALGFRTGLSLCMAYVPCEPGETLQEMRRSRYEIQVAGERYGLRALAEAAYDPARSKLRG